jgi:hypothetical protein
MSTGLYRSVHQMWSITVAIAVVSLPHVDCVREIALFISE